MFLQNEVVIGLRVFYFPSAEFSILTDIQAELIQNAAANQMSHQ